ncbi:hypothetical protein Trydic_g14304 [Trypoxylus dichotomus]
MRTSPAAQRSSTVLRRRSSPTTASDGRLENSSGAWRIAAIDQTNGFRSESAFADLSRAMVGKRELSLYYTFFTFLLLIRSAKRDRSGEFRKTSSPNIGRRLGSECAERFLSAGGEGVGRGQNGADTPRRATEQTFFITKTCQQRVRKSSIYGTRVEEDSRLVSFVGRYFTFRKTFKAICASVRDGGGCF